MPKQFAVTRFYLSLIAILFTPISLFAAAPVIAGFSPLSGPAGTILTIEGQNFSDTASADMVFFGPVAAVVISASPTTLIVTVPAGAGYAPLTVTCHGLTCYSSAFFTLTFNGNIPAFTASTFGNKADFPTTGFPTHILLKDLNNDGKPDMAVVNSGGNSISVYKNITMSSIPFFAAKTDYQTTNNPGQVSCGDLNGDGKPDLVITMFNQGNASSVLPLINISSGSDLLFQPGSYVSTGQGSGGTVVNDFDGDGKPDIAVISGNSGKFSVLRNASSGGIVSFDPIVDFSYYRGEDLAAADFDGDGKPDIVVTATTKSSADVFLNTSTPGNISFADKGLFSVGAYPTAVKPGDFDGDNKIDIAAVNYSDSTVSILKNTSSGGNISFENAATIKTIPNPQTIEIGDLDGDGLPDLVVGNNVVGDIGVIKNLFSGSQFLFASPVYYNVGNYQSIPFIADVNSDGHPDIAATNSILQTVSVLTNKIGYAIPVVFCSGPVNTTLACTTAANSYQWQVNTGSGFYGLSNNGNYAGVTTATLQITNMPATWNNYHYRCLANGIERDSFDIQFSNTWTGAAGTAWENPLNWSCGVVPGSSSNVIINSGTINVNSNAVVQSLTLNPGVILTVLPGVQVSVLEPGVISSN